MIRFDDEYKIEFKIQDEYTSETKEFIIDKEYFNNLSNNGHFEWKGELPKSKVKIIHLLSQPTSEREQRSIESISKFKVTEYDFSSKKIPDSFILKINK